MLEAKSELARKNIAPVIAKWLDFVDQFGPQIPRQELTDKKLLHPLTPNVATLDNHQFNLQLGVIIDNVLNNTLYFQTDQAMTLVNSLQNEDYLKNNEDITSPKIAAMKLIDKQAGYLERGESWQFAKVGLEISPQAQKIAYKLHALEELLEPFSKPELRIPEDQLVDIFTKEILDKADHLKLLVHAIGPYPASVRWMDFLPGAENPTLAEWIEKEQSVGKKQEFAEILLNITLKESQVTPGTIIQLLKKKTFRSTGAVPPLRAENVADPHRHVNKVELYLPLMGAGSLKVRFAGEDKVHSFAPSPNMPGELDLSSIGAKMIDGIPVLIYKDKEYKPEGHFITVPLENGKFAQWIVVKPGDVHDFQNVGISPASVFALTLGFPKEEGLSLDNDFYQEAL